MNLNEMIIAQQLGRNDAERYEMLTGRKAPWPKADNERIRR